MSHRLNFENLPLIETAVRVSFASPIVLTYAVVNAVGRELDRTGFSQITEPKQFELAPGFGPSPTDFGPNVLPGAVFTGHPQNLAISLHSQVLVARWLRNLTPEPKDYPRFEVLRDALWHAVDAVASARPDQSPSFAVVNMSYLNFVRTPGQRSDVREYLSASAQIGAMQHASEVRKVEGAWKEANDVDVRFALEQSTAQFPEESVEGHSLLTAAGKRVVAPIDARQTLEDVHERLQTFFLELISETARREWRLTEMPHA